MKNMKTTITTALLLLAMVSGAEAQEKWDFALVLNESGKIRVIQSNQPVQLIETGMKANDPFGPVQKLLEHISKMTEEGWEVVTFTSNGQYYLRKKKN